MRPYFFPQIKIQRLGNRTAFMQKNLALWLTTEVFDATGDQWVFLLANNHDGKISFKRDGQWTSRKGRYAAFLPLYSLVHWQIKRGNYEIHAVFSDVALPDYAPTEPISFPYGGETPLTVDAIFDILKNRPEEKIELMALDRSSAVARRAKTLIDQHFRDGTSLTDISRKLGYSPSLLSREFRACYGMTAVAYEKQVRLYGALKNLVLNNESIQSAATEVGFNNLSLFNRQFKAEFFTTPSRMKAAIAGPEL